MKDFPIIKITILFISGILFEKILCLNLEHLILIIALNLITILSFSVIKNLDLLKFLCVYLLIFLLGAASYSLSINSLKPFPFKTPKIKDAVIYGKVNSIELDRSYEIRGFIETDSIIIANKTIKQQLTILGRFRDEKRGRLDSLYNVIKTGNVVKLIGTFTKGRERRNPGEFDYQKYLEINGISGILNCYSVDDVKIASHEYNKFWESVFQVRKAIDKQITMLHDEKTAGLLKGLILADKSEVSYESQVDFINTGVIHILAVSGSNVALILLIFQILVGRFNLTLRSILSILCLVVFLLITGFSPSIVRASVMGIVLIISFMLNRSSNLFNMLALSGLIILIINPVDLFNPGFQLSFAAVVSITILVPFFQNKIKNWNIRNKFVRSIILITLVTLSAQIGTLPFILYYFGKLSIVSLLANLVVVPIIGLITGIGLFTLIISIFSNWIAGAFAIANGLLSDFVFWSTHYLSGLSFSFLSIRNFSVQDAVIFYSFIILFFFFYDKFRSITTRILLTILIISNIIILCSLDTKIFLPENVLSILTIDVGQGDAILVKFPNNKTALIDAGETSRYFDNGDRIILPLLDYLGIKKIDYGFISHIDSDHYSGFFSLIEKGRIGKIFKPVINSALSKDIKFENYLRKRNIPYSYYNRQLFKIGNTRAYVLNKAGLFTKYLGSNNNSGVIKICYNKTSFLFTGDLGFKGERYIINSSKNLLSSDVLKVSHHGSKYGTGDEFLSIVKPKISVISDGVLNKFKHPSPETIEKLKEIDSKIYRTDIEGAILLQSDGINIKKIDWHEL